MKSLTLAALGLIAGYTVADAGTSAQTSPAIEGPIATLDQAKCDSVWKVAAPSGCITEGGRNT